MKQARSSYTLLALFSFAIGLGAALIPATSEAAVDLSQCPSPNGRFKQNGRPRGAFLTIATLSDGKAFVYDIGGVRYQIDEKVHARAGSAARYVGTCSDDTVIIKIHSDPANSLIRISSLGATSFTMETSKGESLVDQLLVDVDKAETLPPHSSSQCPADMNEAYISADRPFKPNTKQFMLIERRSNGITFHADEEYPITGARVAVGSRVVKGSCFQGVVYANTYEADGEFLAQEVFTGLSTGGPVHVMGLVVTPSGKNMVYRYRRMYTDDGELIDPNKRVVPVDADEDED